MKEPKKILIIKMSSFGDIIQSLPVVVALRKSWPHTHITWAVHEMFQDLIPGPPYVDECLVIERKKLFTVSYLRELYETLHQQHYDMVLDLQGILKSTLVTLVSGASKRYGYCDSKEGSWLFHKRLIGSHADGHMVERYLDTVRELGLPVDSLEYPNIDLSVYWKSAYNKLMALGGTKPYSIMAIATRWKHKDWPSEYFANFAEALYRQNKSSIVLVGTKDDRQKAMEIKKMAPSVPFIDLTGETSLKELLALIQEADFFIGGDSGPTHFATACQIPMVALYGATYPSRYGPYGNALAEILVSNRAPKDSGQLANKVENVMEGITPEMALEAYQKCKQRSNQ